MTDPDNAALCLTAEQAASVLLPGGDLYPEPEPPAGRPPRHLVELRCLLPADANGPPLELMAALRAEEVRDGLVAREGRADPRTLLALRLAAAACLVARSFASVDISLSAEGHCVHNQRIEAEEALPWLVETLEPIRRAEAGERRWRESRNAAIAAMPFPFDAYLPGQHALARETWRIFRDGRRALFEAPTGGGKTVAVLFGAIKALGFGHLDRLMFATARGTGRLAPLRALRAMAEAGSHLRTVVISSKAGMCASPDTLCPDCPLGKDYYVRLPRALAEAWAAADVLGPGELKDLAQTHGLCPFELSLDLATRADLLIGDYNYLFAPGVALQRFFQNGEVGLVVDEAHNLEDRVRALLSPSLASSAIESCAGKHTSQAAREACGALGEAVRGILARTSSETRLPAGAVEPLRPVLRQLLAVLGPAMVVNDPASRDLRDAVLLSLASLDRLDDSHAALALPADPGGAPECLKFLCLDPGRHVGAVLAKAKGAVLFSATLSPASHYRHAFGLDVNTPFRRFEGPERGDTLGVLIHDGLDIRYRNRAASAHSLADLLASFVLAQPGNVLLYFPSFAYLADMASLIRDRLPGIELIEQPREGTLEDRQDFLSHLAQPGPPQRVGALVMGGVYSESIEWPEGVLSGLCIVSVGLPGVCAERDCLRGHYEKIFGVGAGFAHAYAYPGMRRVLQAAGRLIRRDGDRGVVLLVDFRFTRPMYFDILPSIWKKTVVSPGGMRAFLQAFWSVEGRRDDDAGKEAHS